MSLLTSLFQHALKILAKTVRQEKEINDIQIRKNYLKLSVDNMIIYVENTKEMTAPAKSGIITY